MTSETSKGNEVEIPIFQCFINRCNLSLDPTSVQKRNPPEADILCRTTEGEVIAFELVELCDSNMAKNRKDGAYIRTSDPSFEILKRKLDKRYATSTPLELLCYVNGRVVSPDNFIEERVTHLLATTTFQYRRVWLLGHSGIRQLWPLR